MTLLVLTLLESPWDTAVFVTPVSLMMLKTLMMTSALTHVETSTNVLKQIVMVLPKIIVMNTPNVLIRPQPQLNQTISFHVLAKLVGKLVLTMVSAVKMRMNVFLELITVMKTMPYAQILLVAGLVLVTQAGKLLQEKPLVPSVKISMSVQLAIIIVILMPTVSTMTVVIHVNVNLDGPLPVLSKAKHVKMMMNALMQRMIVQHTQLVTISMVLSHVHVTVDMMDPDIKQRMVVRQVVTTLMNALLILIFAELSLNVLTRHHTRTKKVICTLVHVSLDITAMEKLLVRILMNVMLILACLMDNMNAPNLPTALIPKALTLAHANKAMNLSMKDAHALTLMNVKKLIQMHISARMK